MAYGNWGAIVKRNGERMRNREDNTPYKEDAYTAGYHQAFGIVGIAEDGTPIPRHEGELQVMHATLGSGRVRLCGRKDEPRLFVDGIEHELRPYVSADGSWSGEVAGVKFNAGHYDGNMLDLWMRDHDGAEWTATCGYAYGAGHE